MILKFRAWSKTEKIMSDVKKIDFNNGEVDARCFEETEIEEVELMCSTGLFDKKGVEIFEGDVITTNVYACIVGFGEYTYFEDEDTQTTAIGFYLSFLNITPATYAPFDKYYWDNCEVIGNIYENELDLIMYEAWKFHKELEDET